MLDAKVVESVKSLSAEEKDDFSMFLHSPYFHKGFTVEELKLFYELILRALTDSLGTTFSKESVHAIVFEGKDYMEGRVDRIMFELNRLVKEFLLIKHYRREENEAQRLMDWSVIQRKKGAILAFEKQFQKFKRDKLGKGNLSIDGYLTAFQLAKEEHEWQSRYNTVKGDLAIPEVISSLNMFYYTQHLELLNRFLLQQKAAAFETPEVIRRSLELPAEFFSHLGEEPILLITIKINQLFRSEQPEPEGFQELIGLLKQFEGDLAPDVLFQFYAYLRSYCTILIDAGNPEFEVPLHEIQRDNLARGYFYHDGKIPPNAMLNITLLAIRSNNLQWARMFVGQHKNRILGDNESQDFYTMNVALCLFAENKFEEALEQIPFGSTSSTYHLMARRLELKTYYELQSELLPSKIDAFKMYVSRASNKTFSASFSELYTNFGNFVLQLSQSMPGDKKRSEQLTQRIQAKKLVAERGWLLEKARELGEAKKK